MIGLPERMIDRTAQTAAAVAESEIKLSPGQLAVHGAIAAGNNVLVTGSAGTGKSTLLRALRRMPKLQIAASTGIAAVNVGGLTLHSWAGLGKGDDPVKDIVAKIQFGRNRNGTYDRICSTKILCIDEISMAGAALLNTTDAVFRAIRKDSRPFGGMQMVFFGDFLQLPPVITTPVEQAAGTFAFQSEAWKSANVKTAMLTQVFRQADAEFSTALNDIRMGECTERAMALLRSRHANSGVVDENPEIRPVIIHTHNRAVDEMNLTELDNIEGPEEVYLAADYGSNSGALATLQKNCLAPERLRIKVGAQVMLLANLDTKLGLANGSVGIVQSICRYSKIPTVKFENGVVSMVPQNTWEIKSDGVVVASRNQIPLRLSYAITTHKSQGMTLGKVRCHLAGVFTDGQTYTALSRVRTADGLFIADGGRRSIRANPDAVRFYRECDRLAAA